MDCNCTTYLCVEGLYNPCSEGMELDIIATETGNWSGKVYFNGAVKTFAIGVISGEKLVLPTSLFNENYVHLVVLYGLGDILFGCYKLKTVLATDSGDYPVNPTTNTGLSGKGYIGNGLDTQIFPDINGKTLLTISMGTQEFTAEHWQQTGASVTWLLDGMLFSGQIVLTWQD